MKKNKLIILFGILLTAIALYLIFQNTSSSSREELRDFTIQDTASITKFFIADRSGHSVTLERQTDNSWTVNGKYPARQEGIDLLMDVCRKVTVRTRVAKAAYNNILKTLATTGIKCEIYQDNNKKPSKVYYVGGSTQDVLGTYMMQENSTVPFIMEIPGFNGYLTPRYSTIEKDWRATTVFSYKPQDIKSISIMYSNAPQNSFVIERTGNLFSVSSPVTHQSIKQVDTLRLANYLENFRNLHFEGWDVDYSKEQQDSLSKAIPNTIIEVTDVGGSKNVMKVYPKPVTKRSMAQADSLGNPLKYDIDRMYAFMEGKNELFTIQEYSFGKIFVTLGDFDLTLNRKLIHKER
jgi:hypothetical protein